MEGSSQPFNAALFLSGNKEDVKEAIENGLPAGYVNETGYKDDESDKELRMAFDFDAVLADDSSEKVYQKEGLEKYKEHEAKYGNVPMKAGPLYDFVVRVSKIQQEELAKANEDPTYESKIRIAVCTARNAPAHKRVVTTLRKWNVTVDEAFFLGGMNKADVLEVYQPHIFFDDQTTHIESISKQFPSVHVPYGVTNQSIQK